MLFMPHHMPSSSPNWLFVLSFKILYVVHGNFQFIRLFLLIPHWLVAKITFDEIIESCNLK